MVSLSDPLDINYQLIICGTLIACVFTIFGNGEEYEMLSDLTGEMWTQDTKKILNWSCLKKFDSIKVILAC